LCPGIVDHDRTEAQLLSLADRLVVTQKIARAQLQVLEVERRLAVLSLLICGREADEQLLQQIAVGAASSSSAVCSRRRRASS